MSSKTPTISDVAERAGVSVPTVSRVLTGAARVSPAKRELVEAAIAELNRRYPAPEWSGEDGGFRTGDRFLLLGRERRWSGTEEKWMGWERKRGKLEELNALLRGEASGSPDALHVLAGSDEVVDPAVVPATGVQVGAGVRLMAPEQLSLAGGGEAVVNVVNAVAVPPPVQLLAMYTV